MKKYILILLSLFSFPLALACELPDSESLLIGCTDECDSTYRKRLRGAATEMGYELKFVDLSQDGDMVASMSRVDAILAPGGADIDPRYYTDRVSPELKAYTEKNLHLVEFSAEGRRRDPFEYNLMQTYLDNEKFSQLPLLGICRGMQMMTVAKGIPLYLDIKTELGIKNRRFLYDWINVTDKTSLMSQIHGEVDWFKGYKLHHQGIRVDYYLKHASEYPSVRLSALSNNEKIGEALEYLDRPALGVQYHPERSATSTSRPVYNWFLTKACEYKLMAKDKK